MSHDLALPQRATEELLAALPEGVREQAKVYLQAVRAPRTNKEYQNDWRAFLGWCDRENLVPLPVQETTLVRYVLYLAQTRKPSGIDRVVTSINVAHRLAGHPSPRLYQGLRDTLQGIRRQKGTAPRKAKPLLAADLRVILAHLPQNLAGLRDLALMTVGLAGGFRRDELRQVTVEDITYVPEGMEIQVRRSKTDQAGKGLLKALRYGQHPETCPVRALKAYLEEAGIQSGPVFRDVRGGRLADAPLTGRSIAKIIKGRAKKAGLAAELISGHSLRAGLVTGAAQAGVPDHDIMRLTGHKSPLTVKGYIQRATIWENTPSGKIGL